MTELEINDSIESLLKQMTLKEKVGQLNQHLYGWQCYKKTEDGFEVTELFKKHIKEYGGVGAIYGILRADAWSGQNEQNGVLPEQSAEIVDLLQNYIKQHTRMKIPAFITEECVHGHMGLYTPMFPTNIGLGCSWNPQLVEKITTCVGKDLQSKHGNLALFTGLDILRDPRWGRSEECFSEDAYLTSRMVEKAVQGFHKNTGIGVVLKHLCAQGACIGGHNSGAANIGERELREIFLPPVEAGVQSGAQAVMAAYNEIDGIPCHASSHLLNGILRDEYGFDGIVMADGCALDRLTSMTGSVEKSAQLAIEAGVDLSLWDDIYTHLHEAVEAGLIGMETIDQSVKRILKLKMQLGLFDNQLPAYQTIDYQDLNLQAARECQVLLKNDGILPIQKQHLKLAVIGPNANNAINQLGDYSPFQRNKDMISLLDGLKQLAPDTIEINYALGCQVRDRHDDGFAEAIKLAKESDLIILALGGSSSRSFTMAFEDNGAVQTSYDKFEMNCGENVDMASLDLDGLQVNLFKEIYKVNPNIVTVLIQGRPHAILEIAEKSQAIICAWYPGNLGGLAIAETIFGINNPSGRLSVSIPYSSMQLPCFYNGKTNGIKVDYVDMPGSALYPFGYGLSYSHMKYLNLALSHPQMSISQLQKSGLDIHLDIYNHSHYDGYQVVQIYIVDKEATITQRTKELKAFDKVFVQAHSQQNVTIHLAAKSFAIWDYQMKHTIETGHVDILIGYDSEHYETLYFEILE